MALLTDAEIVAHVNAGDRVEATLRAATERRAVAWLERETGRPLDEVDGHVVYVRGGGGHEMVLPYPVKPSGTLAIAERWGIGDDWSTVTASNYERITDTVLNTDVVLRTDATWPRGEWLVRLTMGVGFTSANCPADLKRTLFRLIGMELQGRFLTIDEVQSERRQDRETSLPWDVQATIKRYRRRDWNQRMLRAAS